MANYWIFSNGYRAITDNGDSIVFDPGAPPPSYIVPDMLQRILEARSLYDDPAGAAASGITFVDVLPDYATMSLGSILTVGDGKYWLCTTSGWSELPVIIKDNVLFNMLGDSVHVALAAISRILAMTKPDDYVQAFSIAGKSVTFPSYAEFLQYYRDLRNMIQAANGHSSLAFDYDCHAPEGTA